VPNRTVRAFFAAANYAPDVNHSPPGVVLVENCDMQNGAWGMCVHNGAAAQVSNCVIHHNKGTGVNVYGGATLELIESEICNNKGRGVSVSDNDTELVMRGNSVHHSSDGVYVYGKAKLTMEENFVHSNSDSGVTVHESGTNASIRRNFLHGNGSGASPVAGSVREGSGEEGVVTRRWWQVGRCSDLRGGGRSGHGQ
jgi:nitrous oxidase accessory protein NosD